MDKRIWGWLAVALASLCVSAPELPQELPGRPVTATAGVRG